VEGRVCRESKCPFKKMKVEVYNEILKEIKSFCGSGRKCAKHLQEKFPRYHIFRYSKELVSFSR
jgi:hypothetical protein